MAGPHATALAGLIWAAAWPARPGDATMDIIRQTAGPLSGQEGSTAAATIPPAEQRLGLGTDCGSPLADPNYRTATAGSTASRRRLYAVGPAG